MKTDRFADSIRRKLDSIRPEFSERDWTKMQAMLKQAGPLPDALPTRPRVFSGQAARLIVAGAAGTVLFLSTTLYQTYELNRLRKSTQAVSQPLPTQADSARTITTDTPMANRTDRSAVVPKTSTDARQTAQTVIRDTVYIDRYVRVPGTVRQQTDRLADATNDEPAPQIVANAQPQSTAIDRATEGSRQPIPDNPSVDERTAAAPKTSVGSRPAPTQAGETASRLTQAGQPSITSTVQPAADKAATYTDGQSTVTTGQPALSRSTGAVSVPDDSGMRVGRERNSGRTTPSGRRRDKGVATDSYATTGNDASGGTNRPTTPPESVESSTDQPAGTIPASSEANGSATIQATPIQLQPVQTGQIAWEQRLMQRSRRMRPARTVVVGGTSLAQSEQTKSVATKPARQSLPSLVKVRVGPGGDLYGKLWGVGGFAELLVGNHLTVSVGLNRASYDNGNYRDEDDFRRENQYRKDFRRQYAIPDVGYRHDILDIRLETVRLVMPITIGYRLPISSSIAITPTLGTNLNLKSQEQGTYVIQQRPVIPPFPPFAGGPAVGLKDFCETRSVSVFNNMTLGANIEWHKKHWGVQAGPVLSITSQPDPDWVSSLSGGIRARAFFQF